MLCLLFSSSLFSVISLSFTGTLKLPRASSSSLLTRSRVENSGRKSSIAGLENKGNSFARPLVSFFLRAVAAFLAISSSPSRFSTFSCTRSRPSLVADGFFTVVLVHQREQTDPEGALPTRNARCTFFAPRPAQKNCDAFFLFELAFSLPPAPALPCLLAPTRPLRRTRRHSRPGACWEKQTRQERATQRASLSRDATAANSGGGGNKTKRKGAASFSFLSLFFTSPPPRTLLRTLVFSPPQLYLLTNR